MKATEHSIPMTLSLITTTGQLTIQMMTMVNDYRECSRKKKTNKENKK